MNAETQKLWEKLKRVQALHERATTEGEKAAAALVICNLVSKILRMQNTTTEVQNYKFQDFGQSFGS